MRDASTLPAAGLVCITKVFLCVDKFRAIQDRLDGSLVSLECLNAEDHAATLGNAICGPANEDLWRFLPLKPMSDFDEFTAEVEQWSRRYGRKTYAVCCARTSVAMGTLSLMRMRTEHLSLEVGNIVFGSGLQRTRAATEAIFILAQHLFDDVGIRRFEWKCDARNERSRKAAMRFGFQFEGVFRKDMIVKGENRDTAWYAMTDDDWHNVEPAFQAWLSVDNFDENGTQKASLTSLMKG
ncbi:MAG: GNAT family protein [Pseudomonadota bacterium]